MEEKSDNELLKVLGGVAGVRGAGEVVCNVAGMRKGRKWQTNCLLRIRVNYLSFPHMHPLGLC